MRGRGLKQQRRTCRVKLLQSPPMRGRGLKPFHQRNRERNAGRQRRGIFVKQFHGYHEFVHRSGLPVCKRNRKLASGCEAGQKRNHEKHNRQPQASWFLRIGALPARKGNRDFGRRSLQVNRRRGRIIAVHDYVWRAALDWMQKNARTSDVAIERANLLLTILRGPAALCRA